MPENVTSTSSAPAPSTAPAGKVVAPSITDSGWQDGSKVGSATSTAVESHEDSGVDPTLDSVLADSPDATDLVDSADPTVSTEDGDAGDASEPAATEDKFDLNKLRQSRDAESAAIALADAGYTEDEIAALWGNKALLIKTAQKLAPANATNDTKETPPSAPDDPFASIFEQAEKDLTSAYGEDSAESKAILGVLKPLTSTITKILTDQITGVKGEYGNGLSGIGSNVLRVETEFAASRLSKDWPKLDTDDGLNAAVNKMAELVRGGEKFPSVKAALSRAASDLWAKEKEVTRRQSMTKEAKAQSQGQPSVRTGRNNAPTVASKAITQDQFDNGIYALIAKHKAAGEPYEKAVEDFKKRYTVKR